MQIETERLRIRSLEVADASPLAAIWSDPEVTRHMGGPRDFAAVREGLEEDAQAGDQAVMDLWTVVEKASGQVIGHCGFLEKDVDDPLPRTRFQSRIGHLSVLLNNSKMMQYETA